VGWGEQGDRCVVVCQGWMQDMSTLQRGETCSERYSKCNWWRLLASFQISSTKQHSRFVLHHFTEVVLSQTQLVC